MENVVYRERVPAGTLVKGLMVTFSVIVVLGTLTVVLLMKISIEDVFGIGVAWAVLAFVLFLFWNYRGIRIQISSDRLFVYYGLFNQKSILLEDVASCETVKASFGRYGGVGVRYGFDGSLAYTTSFGNAVRIVPWKGRAFVFSSNKPEEICQIIEKEKNA
jgi:hypothetical protein